MTQHVEAIYEHGVLRPLVPLALAESQRVKLTISDTGTGHSSRDMEFLKWAQAEVAAMTHIPSIEEVREVMSEIPGSMAEDLIAEREDLHLEQPCNSFSQPLPPQCKK
jgi:predicted DNA-binding antitoxin AbrB/MazE fold protein